MLIFILLLSIVLVISSLFAIETIISNDSIERIEILNTQKIQVLQEELDKKRKELKEYNFADTTQPLNLKKGERLSADSLFETIEVFFDKDEKYALLLPMYGEKLFPNPIIFKMGFLLQSMPIVKDREALEKGVSLFKNFKQQNPDKFL